MQLDDRILEHLDDVSWDEPAMMAARFRSTESRAYVRERCQWLAAAGLIGPLWSGTRMYEITTSGQLYLDGDLDTHDVPAPGPVRVGPPPRKHERIGTLG
ncbi:hypothetical protein J2754_001967 [Halarchaeum solikamskense]|uniref:hypothetical protein n=1 Tax=Halarchaeum nitratireducens TaxID=489913 RepID=UPI001B3AD044|nr:hypothetical protein [Halarchaeum solikamskense]MBP2251636.1 hypothetical protein [Halarchaeum solikamskense]